MKMRSFGPKYQLIHQNPAAFIHAFEGAIGSGKTTFTLMQYARFIRRGPKGAKHVMVGRTQDAVFDNVGAQLQAIYGERNVEFRRSSGASIILFGITIRVYGANNKDSLTKIQGQNLYSAYVDEVVNIPESFFVELRNRLRVPGAQMWVTCNPGGSRHWFLKNWLEKAALWIDIDGQVHTYTGDDRIRLHRYTLNMQDNAANLPDWYIEETKKTLSGVWLRRNYYCEWVDADGIIYTDYSEDLHVLDPSSIPTMDRVIALGVDYGALGNARGILLGVGDHPFADGKALYALREWAPDGDMAPSVQSQRLRGWLSGFPADLPQPQRIYLDPSAESFYQQLTHDKVRRVQDAMNAVLPGIQTVAGLFATDRLFISADCKKLIDEIPGYIWDEKAAALGQDKPLKVNDHSCDALRYAVFSTVHQWKRYFPTLPAISPRREDPDLAEAA